MTLGRILALIALLLVILSFVVAGHQPLLISIAVGLLAIAILIPI